MDQANVNSHVASQETDGAAKSTGAASKRPAPKGKAEGGKGSKRKKRERDVNSPKCPLTAYMRFINDRRPVVRLSHPELPYPEITRIVAAEWTKLSPDEKQKYQSAYEADRVKYQKELQQYKESESYKQVMQKQKETQPAEKNTGSLAGFDIPIFTEEFLEHNKTRESELRTLRKTTVEYEEQNSVMSRHIEGLKGAVNRLEVATLQQRSNNTALEQHLQDLRTKLTAAFANTPLPATNEVPTVDTIDSYMAKLHTFVTDSSQQNEKLTSSVREIVNKFDYGA